MSRVSSRLRAQAELELRRRRAAVIEGVDLETDIPEWMTFLDWVDKLSRDGMRVDGHPFTLDNRPAMRFVYSLIPSTIEEAHKLQIVLMKCAQVGFTVMEMLAMIYMSIKFKPCKVGMYLPDMKLATIKSTDRFMPIVRTIPPVHRLLKTSSGGNMESKSEGNVLVRTMGESKFFFLWTSGKSMTESMPLDVVSFDEVQNMTIADMEKTSERLSGSNIRFTLMGSTAKWPDMDIHYFYKKGTQHQFWTFCTSCGESSVLDDYFPECIAYDDDEREYKYVCRHCGGYIEDSQEGDWRPLNPDAPFISLHFPQFLSPTISPRDIIEAYLNADDMANFYNRKRGKPYTDPSQVPINLELLNECAELGMALGVEWRGEAKGAFMGIDQMGAFNVVIVAERMSSGHMAIIHVEMIYDNDPFARCDEMMVQFGVSVCVVETLPNYNDAKRFANRHPGRVFLAGYTNMEDDMLRWGDASPTKAERKTSEEDRDKYTVTLDQYKCMQVALSRIQNKVCVFPNPQGLTQEVKDKGVKKTVAVLKDVVFHHFTCTALIAEKDAEQKKFKRRVVKVGIDPHFSYAFMLLNVAWARSHGTGQFILPDAPAPASIVPRNDIPIPDTVAPLMQIKNTGTCGGCSSFDSAGKRCMLRNLITRAAELACDFHVPVD